MILNEFTQSELVNLSKTPGFNRFNRRMSITNKEIKIDKVILGNITSDSPHLDIYFKVRSYVCSIRLINFMARVRLLNSQSKYRNNLRKMLELAMKQTLQTDDLLINCTCPDFYYRFSYSATFQNYGFNTNQYIPAKIRNPQNKGSCCKHLTRIINAPYVWKNKVITAVLRILKDNPSLL